MTQTEQKKYTILEINGGIGKNIMATAVCEAIKKQHPDRELIVLSSWVEPLIHNPFVHRVYKSGNAPYIYDDVIKGNDVLFLCQEPYRSHGYLSESKSLIESWCDCIGVKYNGEKPMIYLTPREEQHVKSIFTRNKPIMLIHPFGGMSKKLSYSWNRDLPPQQAQALVDAFSNQYHIIQIGLQEQIKLRNVEFTNVSIRDIFGLIKISSARVFIDSFAQHVAACFNKPSVVCWITNKPIVFGYDMHYNVEADWNNVNPGMHYIDGYFQKFEFGGSRLHDYPFKDSNVFDLRKIVEGLKSINEKANNSL